MSGVYVVAAVCAAPLAGEFGFALLFADLRLAAAVSLAFPGVPEPDLGTFQADYRNGVRISPNSCTLRSGVGGGILAASPRTLKNVANCPSGRCPKHGGIGAGGPLGDSCRDFPGDALRRCPGGFIPRDSGDALFEN